MADNPDAAPDNVVPLYSKALLPHRIPAARFADAMRELRDNLRGSLREDGVVARIAHIFERLMWVIAKGDDLQETVFPTATELALALDELDDEIAALRERPETSADPERAAQLERDLATARSALDALHAQHRALEAQQRDAAAALEVERADRTADRIAHGTQVASLTRDLESERAARAAAERVRLDELRTTLAALRAESTSSARAFAALTDLVARTGTAHDAVAAAIDAMGTMTATDSGLNLAAARAKLGQRKRILDGYLERVDDLLGQVAEELTDIPDAKELEAMQRTGGVRVPEHIRREVAVHVMRRQQLEGYSNVLIALKQPVEQENGTIEKVLAAIDLVSQPPPPKAALPTIPEYPTAQALEEMTAIVADAALHPTGAATTEAVATPMGTNPLAVRLAVVLYDAVAQTIDAARNFTVSRIMKSAEAAGILQRYGWTRRAFIAAMTARASWEPESVACLHFRGTLPNGNASTATYRRTQEPIPDAWTTLVTDGERRAFLDAFRSFVPTKPAGTR